MVTGMGPIDTIQAVYAAFGRGDVAAILERVTDDADWCRDVPGVPHLRHGVGREAAASYFAASPSTSSSTPSPRGCSPLRGTTCSSCSTPT
jgi:ketosteroid isomerase-like protein